MLDKVSQSFLTLRGTMLVFMLVLDYNNNVIISAMMWIIIVLVVEQFCCIVSTRLHGMMKECQ